MAQQFPIQLHSVVNLAEQGISAGSFRFGNVAVDGDRNLVVKDTETNELYIFSLNVTAALLDGGAAGQQQPSQHQQQQPSPLLLLRGGAGGGGATPTNAGPAGSSSFSASSGSGGNPAFTFTKKPTQAEAALMHPSEKIVALRAKTEGTTASAAGHVVVQVLHLETKARMATTQLTEPIVYWRWVGPRLLALVTDRAVYHWNLQPASSALEAAPSPAAAANSSSAAPSSSVSATNNNNTPAALPAAEPVAVVAEPVKICNREGRLAEAVQVISYAVDKDLKWSFLTGISTQDGGKTIDGSMQLYSMELKKQQQLEGHAACFSYIVMDETIGPQPVLCFTEKKRGSSEFKLHIRDIYSSRGEGGQVPLRLAVDIQMRPDVPTDFPLSIHISQKYGVVYIITKGGYLLLFDALTGTQLFRHRILQDAVFLATDSPQTGGILTVNKRGLVCLCTVNMHALIPYISQALVSVANRQQIAQSLAKRYGLPGSEEVLTQEFNQLFAAGNYKAAARVAATLKSGLLRTPQILQQFKAVPTLPQQTSPILLYFSTLLDYGKLNYFESIELVKPVALQRRKDFLQKWLDEDKLTCSEEVGDIVRQVDTGLAVRVYKQALSTTASSFPPSAADNLSPSVGGGVGGGSGGGGSTSGSAGTENSGLVQKVLQSLVDLNQWDQLLAFAQEKRLPPTECAALLRRLLQLHPEQAVHFAQQLLSCSPPLMDLQLVVNVLLQQQRIGEFTALLLELLKGDRPEQAALQTQLLEVNLLHSPQVAETIFQMEMLSHFDRPKIAALCEKAGLYQRALELYTELSDIRRVLVRHGGSTPSAVGGATSRISQEWLLQFLGKKLPPEACVELLLDMLRASSQNLQTVVAVAINFHEQIGALRLVEMFERFGSYEGIFYFLGSILAFSNDPEVHFKYIEAAAKLNHTQEVERVCRESKVYDPQRVKEFLKQAELPDPRALMCVCDVHDWAGELAEYLFKHSLLKYLELYVTRVSPQQAPAVIGALLDQDAPEDLLRSLLQAVKGRCAVQPLVEQCERRSRLKLLLPWLEARAQEGVQEPSLHNALAKIYIDTNHDAETFLKTNAFYDSLEVGKYCEERDPHLAFTAYKRAWGSCDRELVELTNKNSLYRLQARYLVERQSAELWAYALREENSHRRAVIDQVVSSALPESSSADEVSAAVNAFISAQLPHELIELLEKIVLHNSDFSSNRNLQNLLLLTAMKADSARILDYVGRLDNFDGAAVAQVALEYGLREEAFTIYKKFGLYAQAADTLLRSSSADDLKKGSEKKVGKEEEGDANAAVLTDGATDGDLERALEFAQRCNELEVWRKLGKAQLKRGKVREAIDSFLKAQYGDLYAEVVTAARAATAYDALVDFLLMARKKISVKDQVIDSELLYAYAKTDRLEELDDFLAGTNTANVQAIGDRLFEEQHYKAAKLLFASLPNYSKLASCFVRLEDFAAAVEAARKAKNPKTWKEVAFAALKKRELKHARTAALHLIVHPDHLDSLIERYEQLGLFRDLTELLEQGLQGERTHVGLYTELGVLYATYESGKLMDYIRQHSSKFNIPRLIRACERQNLWKEAVFLHMNYDEYEQAASCLINHPTAWTHELFVQVLQRVSNSELLEKALQFYLEYHPLQTCALLRALGKRMDHSRVVQFVRRSGRLALIEKFLIEVQPLDFTAVNEAVNELLVEAEDVQALEESILQYQNFDQLALAKTLHAHERLAMRRLAALLYKRNKKFKQAIELSKADRQYQDAIDAARDSGSSQLVSDLLGFFLSDLKDPAGFAACLYACYPLVKPDIALELSWKHKCIDYCMPFLIQVVREVTTRLDNLDRKEETREKEEEKQKSAPNDYIPDFTMPPPTAGVPMLTGLGGLALMPPTGAPSYPTTSAFGSSIGGGVLSGLPPPTNSSGALPFSSF